MIKKATLVYAGIFLAVLSIRAQSTTDNKKKTSGNPVFPGWYADPEAVIFGKEYWIYPTYSDRY
ncbi:MAG TPA: arabinan endo-1,5-alpha-L-arabinosidase, partial [Ohtaekwangia sp.]